MSRAVPVDRRRRPPNRRAYGAPGSGDAGPRTRSCPFGAEDEAAPTALPTGQPEPTPTPAGPPTAVPCDAWNQPSIITTTDVAGRPEFVIEYNASEFPAVAGAQLTIQNYVQLLRQAWHTQIDPQSAGGFGWPKPPIHPNTSGYFPVVLKQSPTQEFTAGQTVPGPLVGDNLNTSWS